MNEKQELLDYVLSLTQEQVENLIQNFETLKNAIHS